MRTSRLGILEKSVQFDRGYISDDKLKLEKRKEEKNRSKG